MGVSQVTTSAGGFNVEGVVFNNGVADFDGIADAIVLDAAGDVSISAPTANQIDIEIGSADDFTFTANRFNVLTGSAIAGPSSLFVPFVPVVAQQALSGAGAVNVTTYYTAFTSTGAANALSLADGVVNGQLKLITHVSDGGSGVLTPTNLVGGTTITFATVAESALLIFNGTSWAVLALYNPAVPGTPPILA